MGETLAVDGGRQHTKHVAGAGLAIMALCALHSRAAAVSPGLPRCIELRRPLSLGVEKDMHHLHITELLVLGESGRRLPLHIFGASSQVIRTAAHAVDNNWGTCSHSDYGQGVPYGVEDHWMQAEVSDPDAPFFQVQVHHKHAARARLHGVILAIKQNCTSDGVLAKHVLSSGSDVIEWDVPEIVQVQAAALARQVSTMRDIQIKEENDLLRKLHKEAKALVADLEAVKRTKVQLAAMVKTQQDTHKKLQLELDFERNVRSNLTMLLDRTQGELANLDQRLCHERTRNTQFEGDRRWCSEALAELSNMLHDAQMQNEGWGLMLTLVAFMWTSMLALTFCLPGKHMATSNQAPDAMDDSKNIGGEPECAVTNEYRNCWDDSVHRQLSQLHGQENPADGAETPPSTWGPSSSSCDSPCSSDAEDASDVHSHVSNGSTDDLEDRDLCSHEEQHVTNAIREDISCHPDDETDDLEEYEHVQCSEPEIDASWFSVVYSSRHVIDAHNPQQN